MRGIRFSTLSVAGFRGISDPAVFDLSAPLTLVFAPNGTGKTTMCEAAEWLLTGQVERLKDGKDFDGNVLRSKFAGETDIPNVAADLIVEGDARFLSRVLDNGQSGARFGDDADHARPRRPHDLLSLLAPAAAADEAHHLTAINLRQRWLKGTRFLSAEALAALVDSDAETIDRRTQVFADLLGIRHLLDAERQCDRYANDLGTRLRALAQLTTQQTAEAATLEQSLAGLATGGTVLSARAEADAAATLLDDDELSALDPGSSLDDRLQALTVVYQRQRHSLDARMVAARQVEAQWTSRTSLERAVADAATLEGSLAQSLGEIEQQGRAAAAEIAAKSSERDGATTSANGLAEGHDRAARAIANLLLVLNRTSALDVPARSLAELEARLDEARWASSARDERREALVALRQDIVRAADDDRALRDIDAAIARQRQALATDEALAQLRKTAADAASRAKAAQALLDATAAPVERLRAAASELLTHDHGEGVSTCPVCAHDWGSADRLRAALSETLATAPEIVEAARVNAAEGASYSEIARAALDAAMTGRAQVAALEQQRAAVLERVTRRRQAYDRLGLSGDETPEAAIITALERLNVADALAELLDIRPNLTAFENPSTPLLANDGPLSRLLDHLGTAVAARNQIIQLHLADLTKAIEDATRTRDRLRASHAATAERLRDCRAVLKDKGSELAALRAAWNEAAPGIDWSDAALTSLKSALQTLNDKLTRAGGHMEAGRAAWSVEARKARLDDLRSELKPKLDRQQRMADRLDAARRARAVFHETYTTISRKQVQDLSRVVNPLFARMHANRVFDRINLGEDADFLHWLADAGGEQLDPGKDFSQGQRQDLALALFLARARSLGGTFFLDEPVVHLDDLNRVGLLDILRATVLEGSQSLNLVITTSSRALARHLVEKFTGVGTVETPFGPLHPLRVIELDGNGRSGVRLSTSYPLQ